jgi:hypothetical protein
MTIRKKRPSASDVLRQEMQQPLVIPPRDDSTAPNPIPTPITTDMNPPTNDDSAAIAQLKAEWEKESKLQQQKLEAMTKQYEEAKNTSLELAKQGQAAAKGKTPAATTATAIVKKDPVYASLTARPTQSREETARRRANTDIGWLD